jgi:hypothetical protein
MISLSITGTLILPAAFLDSSLNIKTDEERLCIYANTLLTQIEIHITCLIKNRMNICN